MNNQSVTSDILVRARRYLAGASVLALLTGGAVPAMADAEQTAELGDIIVSAQRVDQKLQDVPAAVSAVTADTLQKMQISTAIDLNRIVPNVKFSSVTGGSAGLSPYVRGGGITDGGMALSESEVGIYLDNVYRARLSAALVDFLELERIEVVRGPQGVLYGRNSSAGAVNMITRAPSAEFSGTVEAGFGTWNERRLKGYVTGALSEDGKWSGSLNGMVRGRDGGRQYNVTLDEKVGDESFEGVQGDVAYAGDTVTGRLTVFYMHTDGDGQWAVPTTVVAGEIVPSTGSYRKVASPIESYTKVSQYGATLRLSADYDTGTFTSITGYSELSDDWRQDFSGGVAGSLIGLPSDDPVALFDRVSETDQWQFSQEFQAAGGLGERLDYVAGVYFFTEKATQDVLSTIFFSPSSTLFVATTDSVAGFGQLTYRVTDSLSLIAGGRYTLDQKKLKGSIGGDAFDLHERYDRFTPKLGVDYKVTPDVLLYASYAQGFKSGGYNGLAGNLVQISTPFLPQYTTAYEAGVKSDLLGGTLRLNLAGFYNKIRNRQQSLTVASGPDIGTFVVENYNATLKGVELEATWRAFDGFTLWGNVSLNDGKYTSCSTTVSAACSIIDNEPPAFPDWSYAVGFDYEVDVGPGSLRLGADFNSRAAYFSTADNVAIGFVRQQEFLGGYVGYDYDRWTVQLSGKNLLQEKGWTTGFGFSVVQPQFAVDPRTLLATVRYKF